MWGELYVYDRLVEMEEKPALREWEPSDLDFVSTSNFSLQCSIGSHTANAKFEWVDYRPAVFRQIKHDCSFLKEVGVTEYSLLLGMHVCSAPFEAVFQGHYTTTHKEGSDDTEKKTSDGPDGTQCDPAEDITDDNSGLSCPIEFESELGIRMTARAVNTHRKEGNLASLCHPRKQPPTTLSCILE
ncbi:hypothetical protein MUK42_23865 [Musa troglodytarum]|uniref:PIPK domain-containing protein n=1 Tax=Musa troglodytarum TaxID=320322 RepID=A0A9E7L848_9LILI|nr:hypothetical protein MUK42_23865 [Musa troglodytarum]